MKRLIYLVISASLLTLFSLLAYVAVPATSTTTTSPETGCCEWPGPVCARLSEFICTHIDGGGIWYGSSYECCSDGTCKISCSPTTTTSTTTSTTIPSGCESSLGNWYNIGEWCCHAESCAIGDPYCYHCPNDVLDCYECTANGWIDRCADGTVPHDPRCVCKFIDPAYGDNTCDGGTCNPSCDCITATCSDSDNGNYPKTAGTCTDSSGSYQDSCLDSRLEEYYCSGDSCIATLQNCDAYDCTTGLASSCSGIGTSTLTRSGDDYICSNSNPDYCAISGTKTCEFYSCSAPSSCQSHSCAGTNYRCYRSNAGSWGWGTSAEATETACDDGFDNDCDGDADALDNDCITTSTTSSTTTTTTTTTTTIIPSGDLVAYWDFEGDAIDESGNGNDGTIYGATFTTGIIGTALSFDGSSDYVEIHHDDSLTGFTEGFTASVWIRPDDTSRRQSIIHKYDTANNQRAWFLEINDNTNFAFLASEDGVGFTVWYFEHNLVAGTWYHIAIVWEKDAIPKLYRDAVPISTTSIGTVSSIYNNVNAPLHIGKSTYSATRTFDGVIDEVKIWNRALSAGEIDDEYQRGTTITPNCQTLLDMAGSKIDANCDSNWDDDAIVADVNKDGEVDILDIAAIGRYFSDYAWCSERLNDHTDACSPSTMTITIYEGANIVGILGLAEDDFNDCGLVNFESSSKPGCKYDDNGYFVYYDPLGNNGGDCDSNFFSANVMTDGFGYFLHADQECEISFIAPTDVEVTLYPRVNIISVPVETSLDDIAGVCGDRDLIFTYYKSSSKSGCLYDDNGYFVYYDPLGNNGGDCDSNFFSDGILRPFVGYYVYFNGLNGDGVSSCTLTYENGELVNP